MSLGQFEQWLAGKPFRWPDAKWSMIWMRRLFEFWSCPPDADPPVDVSRWIAFLRHVKGAGTPAWQRHQAAITVGRYQQMRSGAIDKEIQAVIHKLGDIAKAAKFGDAEGAAIAAAKETRFPAGEHEALTALRETLRRRRYKYDTEKAFNPRRKGRERPHHGVAGFPAARFARTDRTVSYHASTGLGAGGRQGIHAGRVGTEISERVSEIRVAVAVSLDESSRRPSQRRGVATSRRGGLSVETVCPGVVTERMLEERGSAYVTPLLRDAFARGRR